MCRCSDVAQWCRWGEVKWSELSAGVYIQLGWLEISTQLQPKADCCSCRLCRGPCLGWICTCQTVCLRICAYIATLPKYGSIPQYFFEFYDNLNEWSASFKYNTESTSHQELPNTENVSLSKGYARLFLAILIFRCLKSMTTVLSWVTFPLINMPGLE